MDLEDQDKSDDPNGDGEGVWSPDIEQSFREALLLYPPCGRRKHILQDEGGGKMYGRNELIARHIMMRTGKSRTRKQVSSHIQVLARRKAKADASSISGGAPSPSNMRPQNQLAGSAVRTQDQNQSQQQHTPTGFYDVWMDRPIATQKIRLVHFSAFIEHRNPFQATTNSANNVIGTIQTTASPSILQQPILNSNSILTSSPMGLSVVQPKVDGMHQQQSPSQLSSSSPYPSAPNQQASSNFAHPLASNHQISTQFNQTSIHSNENIVNISNQINHANKPLPVHQDQHMGLVTVGPSQVPLGCIRHSYVQIDYSQPIARQINKLEHIDIGQIEDKFPEIGRSEGFFQRGPPDAFFLVKFWADINDDYEYNIEDQNSYFGFSCHFETIDSYKSITCSTKACSYGLQVVEKVEKIHGTFNPSNGRYSYNTNRSPMCEFMVQFIKKLRQLPRTSQMNSVLENFTVLQVVTSESSSDILLCLAFVFEVVSPEKMNGPQYNVYKLTKD